MVFPLIQMRGDHTLAEWSPTTLRDLEISEKSFEDVLAENTTILGLESVRTGVHGPFKVFRQLSLPTPSERIVFPDITLLTSSGHVVIVEVKRFGNPELRDRNVIAQITEYASSFAELSESQLIECFAHEHGDSTWSGLVDHLFGDHDDPEELSEVLRHRISTGQINLVVACDKIPAGLPGIVRGVTSQSAFAYELDLLEITPFVSSGTAVNDVFFVPAVRSRTETIMKTAVTVSYPDGPRGAVTSVTTTSMEEVEERFSEAGTGRSQKRSWTVEEIDQIFRESTMPGQEEFLDFCLEHSAGDKIVRPNNRTTQATVSFFVDVERDGQQRQLVLFYWPINWSHLTVRLWRLARFISDDDLNALKELLKSLFGDDLDPDGRSPSLPNDKVPHHLNHLHEVVQWIRPRLQPYQHHDE